MRKIRIMSLACVMMLVGNAYALDLSVPDNRFEIQLRGWDTSVDLEFSEIQAADETDLNIDDVFKIGDETFPDIRLRWNLGQKNSLYVNYTRISYDSVTNPDVAFEIDDVDFTSGSKATSNLDIDYYRFGWRRSFVAGKFRDENDRKIVDIEFILELMVFDIDTTFKAETVPAGVTVTDGFDIAVPIPVIGLAISWAPIERLTFFAQATGLDVGVASLVDAEIGIKVKIIDAIDAYAGYRVFDLQGEDDGDAGQPDEKAQFKISGAFLGVGFNF